MSEGILYDLERIPHEQRVPLTVERFQNNCLNIKFIHKICDIQVRTHFYVTRGVLFVPGDILKNINKREPEVLPVLIADLYAYRKSNIADISTSDAILIYSAIEGLKRLIKEQV